MGWTEGSGEQRTAASLLTYALGEHLHLPVSPGASVAGAARAEGGAHLRVVRAMLRRSSRNASGSALLSSTPSFSSACAEHGAPTQ